MRKIAQNLETIGKRTQLVIKTCNRSSDKTCVKLVKVNFITVLTAIPIRLEIIGILPSCFAHNSLSTFQLLEPGEINVFNFLHTARINGKFR